MHDASARRLGVDDTTLDALADYARDPSFTPRERAALAASVALTREPRALPPAVRCELEAHYDEGEIVELVSLIAAMNALTRLSNVLGVEPKGTSINPGTRL